MKGFCKPFYINNIVYLSRNTIDEDFLSKAEFRNIIFYYRYMFLAKVDFYETVRAELKEVIKELKEYRKTN